MVLITRMFRPVFIFWILIQASTSKWVWVRDGFYLGFDLQIQDQTYYFNFQNSLPETFEFFFFFFHIIFYLDLDPSHVRNWFQFCFHLLINGFGSDFITRKSDPNRVWFHLFISGFSFKSIMDSNRNQPVYIPSSFSKFVLKGVASATCQCRAQD